MENASPSLQIQQESEDEIEDSTAASSGEFSSNESFNDSIKEGNYFWYGVIIAILASILLGFIYKSNSNDSVQAVKKFCPDFLKLKEQYENQDEYLWKLLKRSAEGAFSTKSPEPVCFMFASEKENSMNSIINSILEVTTGCLNSTSKPIILTPSELSSPRYIQDRTKVVHELKPQLEKSGILLVKEFNRVSTKVVPAFHSICDTYNPLVRRAFIIFTMLVPSVSSDGNLSFYFIKSAMKANLFSFLGNPSQFMNEYLQELWKSLPQHTRESLITRVTENSFILV
jgi:hypothetical protein